MSERIENAISLADHLITTILEEDPGLLVSSLDDQDETGIRDTARKFGFFRLALIEELVNQPLSGDTEEEDDDEDEEEEDEDSDD